MGTNPSPPSTSIGFILTYDIPKSGFDSSKTASTYMDHHPTERRRVSVSTFASEGRMSLGIPESDSSLSDPGLGRTCL